ncbi:MAG: bifunctional (p)ppGpp synthetase/guanosine-3',5'-bis(diphosphate) 3'-pyrophosphohydrolase [Clostridia bacterium]|nr:bifunctional (p)ppGpp synthetase/guanosine-3',5'-bis(diphosphate) 3'-pyrophosphohydrolase [Clostridia bacterium]
MNKIIEKINNSFNLSAEDKDFFNRLFEENNPSQKDEEIINNLIDYKLDYSSVLAYFVDEHNLIGKHTFNNDVVSLAQNLNALKDYGDVITRQEEDEVLRKQFIAMCKDIRVIVIKLCQVLYDANHCDIPPTQKQRELLLNVRNIYAPLAERLGFNSLKSTLEDLCLKNLDPEIYKSLEENVLLKKEENAKQIELTKSRFEKILQELGLKNAIITSRQKHFSSVYKKIKQKNVNLAQIYDLVAMRIIVDTVEQCYAVLGKIHGIYRPMEGRFKDYIASPKPNGYQSLHTTIIVENERPLEVQIRTHEMHKNAEFGVDVAHWVYKEKRKTTDLDKKLSWLREIMDASSNLSPEEFVETLKTNLYSGRIFVQTPKGKVLEFPDGATVLDFAYAIHTDIGNSCIGGKISGKMVPLSTKLSNNDIVEIITSPNSKGPSRDWLSMVKTAGARSKINSFFKHELKEEYIKTGKTMIELAIKNKGLQPTKVMTDEIFEKVLYYYAFNTPDELYATVGYGSITTTQVVNKLVREYERLNNQDIQTSRVNAVVVKKNKDGVLVDGDSGMLIRFAGCCTPILGESIVGYISRGRGVTIHKSTCQNLRYLEQERLIKADWADMPSGYKVIELNVVANEDDRLISNISLLIANLHFGIMSLETKRSLNRIICDIKIKISNPADKDKILAEIKKINNVLEVNEK